MRRVLQLRPLRPGAGGRVTSSSSTRESDALALIERVRARPARFRDTQITMAHGAGGKATQTLVNGLFVPAFGRRRAARARRRGRDRRPGDDHRQLRRQADPLPRRIDRRAGRQRHGQRPGDGRCTPARADALASCSRRASRPTTCAPRSRRSPPRRRGGGRRDRRGRHQGRRARHAATRCTSRRPGSAASTRAPRSRRARCGPATGSCVSGPIGEHGTAVMLARGEFELEAPVVSDTRSLWPAVDVLLRGRRAPRCAVCATRPAAASPPPSTSSRRRRRSPWSCARPPCRCGPRSPVPARSSASTPCTSRTRACSSPSSRPRRRTTRSPRSPSAPGCAFAAEIGEVKTEPPGMVLVETAFGGRRVMDLLVGDPLPRIC